MSNRGRNRGQGIVEYTLIVAMIALVIIGTASAIGFAVRRQLQTTASSMK